MQHERSLPNFPDTTSVCSSSRVGDVSRGLGWACHFPRREVLVLCAERSVVLLQQIAHFCLAKSHRDTIHASLNPCSKIMGLKCILGAKFAGSLGDCSMLKCETRTLALGYRHTLELEVIYKSLLLSARNPQSLPGRTACGRLHSVVEIRVVHLGGLAFGR